MQCTRPATGRAVKNIILEREKQHKAMAIYIVNDASKMLLLQLPCLPVTIDSHLA